MKFISPIQAFIFASVGIHGSLLVIPDYSTLTLPGATGSVMSVKLEDKTQDTIEQKTSAPQHKKNTVPTQQTKTKNVDSEIPEKNNSIFDNKASQQTALAAKNNASYKAHVISIIYNQLNQHFRYPRIAQQKNWQGQVLLSFHITTEGRIQNIKINHSSGYNVLDQAAVTSLQKIGILPQLTSWLITGMEIQIPVIYQLTEG